MNQTNITSTSDTVTSGTTSQPWKESGAMVYVALTVATLSAVIMCCVWFIKQRINNDYGTVREDDEEEVELNRRSPSPEADTFDEKLPEEEQPPNSDAFTLEDSDSDTSEKEDEGSPEGPFVDAHAPYTDNAAV